VLPTPPSVQNLTEGASPLEQGLGIIGGTAYPENVTGNSKLGAGDYRGLAPQQKAAAVPAEAWRVIAAHPQAPKSLAQYPNYQAWADARRQYYLPRAQAAAQARGLSEAEANAAVEKRIAANPVTKAWQAARTRIKNQWVIENPQLALDLYNEEQKKGWKDQNPAYSLTQEQLRAAHKRLADLQKQPVGAR
jgi:hypothetical protein